MSFWAESLRLSGSDKQSSGMNWNPFEKMDLLWRDIQTWNELLDFLVIDIDSVESLSHGLGFLKW